MDNLFRAIYLAAEFMSCEYTSKTAFAASFYHSFGFEYTVTYNRLEFLKLEGSTEAEWEQYFKGLHHG